LFVAEELAADRTIAIEGNQAHYLSRVMRVGEGDTIILCDDITGEWAAQIESVGKRRIEAAAVERLREKEAVPDFWLCPALVKKDRFDLILEKATELGVARIRPVVTRRCVVDKLNAERARTVTVEAAEQCARTALPIVDAPDKLDTLLRDWPQDRALLFADETGGEPASGAFTRLKGPSALLIGPEGGFDEAERAAIRALPQAVPIGLGPRILRAETAAIAATALWMAVAGDWADERAEIPTPVR
jgi:16S rRNA (uracil1498-N3)-methyltransferase